VGGKGGVGVDMGRGKKGGSRADVRLGNECWTWSRGGRKEAVKLKKKKGGVGGKVQIRLGPAENWGSRGGKD